MRTNHNEKKGNSYKDMLKCVEKKFHTFKQSYFSSTTQTLYKRFFFLALLPLWPLAEYNETPFCPHKNFCPTVATRT